MTPAEVSAEVERAKTSNKRWSADQCAIVLEIDLDDHVRLKMVAIGANDDPNYERRNDLRRLKDKNRKAEKRLIKGVKPRSKSLEATKPWADLGMSQRSWYRKGKPSSKPCKTIDNVVQFPLAKKCPSI